MMKKHSPWLVAVCLAALAATTPTPARADGNGHVGEIEIFAGYLWADYSNHDLDLDDFVYGARGGYNFTDRFALQGTVERFDGEDSTGSGLGKVTYRVQSWFVDVSFVWQVNPDDRATFMVYGGPGWGNFDADITGSTIAVDDSEFTLHAGLGLEIALTKHIYLRPDVRTRWYELDESFGSDDSLDWEITGAIGFWVGR